MANIELPSEEKLMSVVKELSNELQKVYGTYLKNIILYGSYARGDYDSESDIDIMLLVDLDTMEQKKYRRVLAEKITDLSIKHDVLISVIDNNYEDFNARAIYVPFYKNVIKEGIKMGNHKFCFS